MIAALIRFEAWYAETGARLFPSRLSAIEAWRAGTVPGLPAYPRGQA